MKKTLAFLSAAVLSLSLTAASSTPAGFTDDLDAAIAASKKSGKAVYAVFSGSDWCYWCKVIEEGYLSKKDFVAEAKKQGGYFMSAEESEKVGRFIMRANGTMNPKIVGRTAQTIADMAGITIPKGTRVLLSTQTTVGKDNPYSREKLCPILAFYVEENWNDACERCMEILYNEGVGHTMTIHSRDESIIREFAMKNPIFIL